MTAAPGRRHATAYRLAVTRVDRLTDDAVALTLHVPVALRSDYAFLQGQHVALSIPERADDVRRSYSLCTPVGGELRVAVKLIPGGSFSEYANTQLQPGDELDVLTPTGSFQTPLDPAQTKHYAAIAAGSGITPILSLAATTLAVEPTSTFSLIYGNRTVASTMFLEELLDLKNLYPQRFALYAVLSREPQSAPLLNGRIDGSKLSTFIETVFAGRDHDEWFLCGPMEMVNALRATLLDRGVKTHQIHRELFYAGPLAEKRHQIGSGETCGVTILLDGRSTTFDLATDGPSVLDAALAVRPDAPYACKGGVCGTCRARLVEGRVDMDGGYALEREELEAGFVLTCQAHPRTRTIVLSFDD